MIVGSRLFRQEVFDEAAQFIGRGVSKHLEDAWLRIEMR
jgi:hypothetical protein